MNRSVDNCDRSGDEVAYRRLMVVAEGAIGRTELMTTLLPDQSCTDTGKEPSRE
jgi:hypothetical protein